MADKGYESRKKWNAANYKQFNVAIGLELAEAFKSACDANGEPMRQAAVRLISEYVSKPLPDVRTAAVTDYSTRAKRKRALGTVLEQLEDLLDAESAYRDNIPESMYNKHESAERAVEAYEEAVAILEETYST